MQFSYTHNEQTYTVSLEVQADGSYHGVISSADGTQQQYHVTAAQMRDGGWWLLLGAAQASGQAREQAHEQAREQAHAHVVTRGTQRDLAVNGRYFTLGQPDTTRRRRAAGGSAAAALHAEMPGQVTDVLVRAGDAVTRGQALVVLEAMKMQLRVAAPRDSVVARVLVEKGQVVERGQVLVELGAAE